MTANGDVYQMGGILYFGTEVDPEDFIWKLDIGQVKAIAAGNMRSYAVLKDGTVWSWKNIVQKKKYAAAHLPGFAKMATIAAGSRNADFAVGLDEKGNPWAWGDNSARNLGFGLPFKMQKGTDASAAPTRNFISNGQLWAYGTNNDYGQLGNGTRANYDTAQTGSFLAIKLCSRWSLGPSGFFRRDDFCYDRNVCS
ncbi:hypothetical protein [Paenibacillus thiaminolyticus]|uniref:Uncharacterized protein n=1 Tax=Paenibacillus thiaminolyticus TaxID=49283 RepID=A0A3A3GJ25_PANTH|nr:hypothetical protein [Paenibacillus thiaminolyticus]RJG24338.1 hypothetical protein DQX05_10820 [Paenibacillus thiaminolyticus]